MKIAYLGKIQLSDVDLSYLNSAQNINDITYFLEITPRFLKGPAFNFSHIYPKTGIFKATTAYPEIAKYANLINLDKFYVVNTCGKFWLLKAFWTNLLLLFFILKNRYDVIHLTWPANIYEFILYLLRRKMVLTVHDPFPHTGLDTKIVRLRRFVAFKVLRNFIILNKKQRERFVSFYRLKNANVIVSRLGAYSFLNAIDTQKASLPVESPYILFSGKISQYKGLDYLLPAMKAVHEKFPEMKLIVAGSGKFHFDIQPYRELPYIKILNRFIPDDELVLLIKKAQFMACPYTDATQSGVIMSAFAFALPVIATNVGGLPEMLGNGKYGLLVKEKSVESLTEGISKLLSEPQILQEYRQNITQSYNGGGELSWPHIAGELDKEYQKIIN